MRNAIDKTILPLSYCLALFYWFHSENPDIFAISAKTASTALLALHSYKTAAPHLANQAGITMGLHCAGDFLIELPGNTVLYALVAFFFGHSSYFSLLQKNSLSLAEVAQSKKLMLGAFGIYAGGFTQLLISTTSGIMQYAIPFYSLALSSMFVIACLQKENTLRISAGASAYVVSDMLIATNLFLTKIPCSSRTTWPLYFLAQNFLRCAYQKKSTSTPVFTN